MGNAKDVIPTPYRSTGQAPVGIHNQLKKLDSGFRRNDEYSTDSTDTYILKTQPKNECLRHCHTATIFEVAKAIWAKFK